MRSYDSPDVFGLKTQSPTVYLRSNTYLAVEYPIQINSLFSCSTAIGNAIKDAWAVAFRPMFFSGGLWCLQSPKVS